MNIFLITRDGKPRGAWRRRVDARSHALEEAKKARPTVLDHAWRYVGLVASADGRAVRTGEASDERVELWIQNGRRQWVNTGYIVDVTELHS